MNFTLIYGIIASLIFSVFFAGIEIAFLSSNKLQIQLEGKQGSIPGRIMSFFITRPTWFIGTTLIGNICALILFAVLATQLLLPVIMRVWPSLASVWMLVVILTFLLTVIILYTAEFLSKSLFIINSNKMVSVMAVPFALISVVLFPVVFGIVSLARLIIVNVLGLEYSKEKPVFGLVDVNQYLKTIHRVRANAGNIELDKKILSNALDFQSVRVRDCMIPRTEICAVPLESGIKKLHEAFIESGHSKIIIFKDSIDDVIGYCHSSALFKKPRSIEEILTPIVIVPETTPANELMIRLINERKSLAIAVDEFGGTSGLVSMEDVIEEIFGEIEDEHDEDLLTEQQLDEKNFLLSARLEIDYLNETYGWDLPTGDYETLGGLIIAYTEDIPRAGETIQISRFTFLVLKTEENKINTVKLTLDNAEESN